MRKNGTATASSRARVMSGVSSEEELPRVENQKVEEDEVKIHEEESDPKSKERLKKLQQLRLRRVGLALILLDNRVAYSMWLE